MTGYVFLQNNPDTTKKIPDSGSMKPRQKPAFTRFKFSCFKRISLEINEWVQIPNVDGKKIQQPKLLDHSESNKFGFSIKIIESEKNVAYCIHLFVT